MIAQSPEDAQPVAASKVPEYDIACRQFIWDLLHELVHSQDPILEKIRRVSVDEIPTEASSPGITVGMSPAPVPMAAALSDRLDTILNMDVDGFAQMMQDTADEGRAAYMPQFFEQLRQVMEATGQVVDAKGKPYSHDLYLDLLEKVDIDFTEDGQPKMPTLVVPPNLAPKIEGTPWTREQLEREKR